MFSIYITITGTPQDMKVFYESLERPNENGDKVVFSFHQTIPSGTGDARYKNKWLLDPISWSTHDIEYPIILTKEDEMFRLMVMLMHILTNW